MTVVPDTARRATASVLFAFAFLCAYFTGVFPPFANPNELSRFETVVAAVDQHTFAIDEVITRLGDHEDKALSGGRTYSNKAPGLSLAAIPVYALLRLFLRPPSSANADAIFYWLRLLTVTPICLLALGRFVRRLSRWSGPESAPLVLAAAGLGSSYLFYARSFFGHAWTAALLFLSWDLILAAEESPAGTSRSRGLWLLGGLIAGWAAISEYTTAPVAVLLALRCLRGGRGRAFALFAGGLAASLAVLAAYDAVCFGSPWVLSSAREAYPEYRRLAARGLFGFGAPSLGIGLRYLFSPARGAILFCPFLAWCVPGYLRWYRSGRHRPDFWLSATATLLFLGLMTGYPNWHGGWSLGSRYLLPILFFPLMAVGWALSTPLARGLFAAALVFSVAGHFVLTATFPYFPDNVPWPAGTGAGWFLARFWTSPTILGGTGAAALLLPAIVVGIALLLAISSAGPMVPRRSVAMLLGLAPLVLLLARPPELSYGARLWRAAVFGAYSGRDPRRDELQRVVLEASTPAETRQAMGAWRVYGPPPAP